MVRNAVQDLLSGWNFGKPLPFILLLHVGIIVSSADGVLDDS